MTEEENERIPVTLYIRVRCKLNEVVDPYFMVEKEDMFGNRFKINSILVATKIIASSDTSRVILSLTEPEPLKSKDPKIYLSAEYIISD